MGPWKSAVFYTLMRFFVFVFFFFGFVLLNRWLFHSDAWLWPLVGAAVVSMAVSYVLLQGPRREMAAGLESSLERRHARADAERHAEEDAEADARPEGR